MKHTEHACDRWRGWGSERLGLQCPLGISGLHGPGHGVRAMTEQTWVRLDLVVGVDSRGQAETNVPAGWGGVPLEKQRYPALPGQAAGPKPVNVDLS